MATDRSAGSFSGPSQPKFCTMRIAQSLRSVHLEEGPREPASLFRSILCAVDLGPQSQRVLEWAAGLAGELNAHLHVAHALPEAVAGAAEYLDQGWRTNLERSARETVAKL